MNISSTSDRLSRLESMVDRKAIQYNEIASALRKSDHTKTELLSTTRAFINAFMSPGSCATEWAAMTAAVERAERAK